MELDELQIKIDANASQANKSINNLVKKLLTLSSSLSSVDTGKLNNIATGIKNISDSATGFKGGKSKELISLSNALRKFSGIDTNSIYGVSSAMQNLARGIGSVGNVNVSGMSNLISSISKLGGKNATQGAKNLVLIKDDLVRFVQGMNSIGSLNFDTSGLSSLIGNIARLGSKSTTQATNNLPAMSTQLQNFVRQMNAIGSSTFDSSSLLRLANAISRLGGKSATQAITNLPALTRELNNLFTTLSRSPSVSTNIIQMTNALANLARNGSRSGTAVRSLSSSLNSYSSSASKATGKSKGLVSQIGMFYARFFLAVRGVKQLWKSIESSMDYVEVLNYFNAAFGQVADNATSQWSEAGYDSAEAYYDSFSKRAEQLTQKMTGYSVSESGMLEATGTKNMGIDPASLMNYQAMFGQMSSSMGIASENALTLSNVLTEIGADLASVKNMDFNKVWEDMASGLAGMSRTLDKYGVNIRNVNLQTKLNELGIQANITALNQNEKALLRTIILLDSTTYAWGDLSDTINQPANQLRLLQSNFSNLARTIGNIFLPIVAKVLPYLNGLAIALQRVAESIVKMLGFKDFDWGGLGGAKGASDALSNIYDEADNTSDALDNATDSAKELKNQLMSFDEVDKLSEPTDTSSTKGTGSGLDASGSAALDKAFQDAASAYQKAWDAAFANMEQSAMKHADRIEKVLEPLKKTFQDIAVGDWLSVGKDVSGMATDILKFARNAVKSVNWDKVGDDIGKFLKGIDWLEIFKESIKLKVSIAEAIAEVWLASFDESPIETALLTAFGFMSFTKVGKDIAKKIGAAVSANLIGPITAAFKSLGGIGGILTMDPETIVGAGSFAEIGLAIATRIIGGIAAAFVGYNIGEEIYSAITGDETDYDLSDYLGKNFNADDWINGINLTIDDFKTGLGEIKDSTVTWWEERKRDWKDGMDKIYNNVSEKVDDIRSKWEDGMNTIKTKTVSWWKDRKSDWTTGMTTIKDTVKDGMDKVGSKFGGALSSIKTNSSNWWTERKNEWSMGVDAIKNTFSDFWTNHASRWFNSANWNFSGIGDGLSSAFTGAIESVKQIWNRFANWLNDKLTWEIKPVKIMGKTVFEGTTIDLGKIPTFQAGGFPEDGLFFSNHNELVGKFRNGKTAVANNEEITAGIERAAYNGMKRALAESNNSSNVNISLEANTAGLFRAVQKEADNYTRRTGESAFVF